MDYYSRVTFSSGDVICHAGRKGMKWGKHIYKKDKTSYENSPSIFGDDQSSDDDFKEIIEKTAPMAKEFAKELFINNFPVLKTLYGMYRSYIGDSSTSVKKHKMWGKRVSNRNMYRVRPTRGARNAK